MKTPTGRPRMAPTRKPHATEPASQPIRMPRAITAAVVPISTEPAPARLSFGVGVRVGSIRAASIAELVTPEAVSCGQNSGTLYDPSVRRLVLVHGSVTNGPMTWGAQRELADRFDVVVLNRPGFPAGPPVERVDFAADADWLLERLEPADDLCGHSYGGVVTLLAAARFDRLRSLTVIEPPAT